MFPQSLLFDAHIHLTDEEYSSYIGHIVFNLRAMKIIACSVTIDAGTTARSFQLFETARDVVRQFVGIHPEAAAREDLDKFKEIFRENLQFIDGVGEIGLDGTYDVPYDKQKQVFNAMLELAESTKKPVSIHSRKALDDILGEGLELSFALQIEAEARHASEKPPLVQACRRERLEKRAVIPSEVWPTGPLPDVLVSPHAMMRI